MKFTLLTPLFVAIFLLHGPFTPPSHGAFVTGQEADFFIGRQTAGPTQIIHGCVAIDRTTDKVFVADSSLHRILRFSSSAALQNGAAAEAVLGQADFTSSDRGSGPNRLSGPRGMWVDNQGRLWVADQSNHRVLRFDNASAKLNGAPADGVLGQINFTDSTWSVSASRMTIPSAVVTDAWGTLFVADQGNHRVLRFDNAASKPNGASANAVLGQPDFYSNGSFYHSATSLSSPHALAIVRGFGLPSPNTSLWVADSENDRVLLFIDANHAANGAPASKVLGQPDMDSYGYSVSATGTPAPLSLATDTFGRLYVGDALSRVLRFDNATVKPNGAAADGILGQTAFDTRIEGSGPGGLAYADSLALDGAGRLWIGDRYNNRVVWHNNPSAKVNGAEADGVLGAPSTATDLTRKFKPHGMAIDPVSNKLFVSDYRRHRVLRFASTEALSAGAGAEAVFGQADFNGRESYASATRMNEPGALTVDHLGNLWVADSSNNRVLRFNNAANRPSGVAADAVFGQANFSAHGGVLISQSSTNTPYGIAAGPNGELWVSTQGRVLRWNQAASKGNNAPADGILGQVDFTSTVNTTDAAHFSGGGLAVDASGRLWVGDFGRNRLLRFDNAISKPNGAPADAVLGQDLFTTNSDGGASPDGVWAWAMAVHPSGRLFVADSNRDRILRWENAHARANGSDADGLLGQVDFGFEAIGAGAGQMHNPRALTVDSQGRLWVAEMENERIGVFSSVKPGIGIAPKNATTATLTFERVAKNVAYRCESSADLLSWQNAGTVHPPQDGEFNMDVPVVPGARQFFRLVEP